jgi:hypothetical protein
VIIGDGIRIGYRSGVGTPFRKSRILRSKEEQEWEGELSAGSAGTTSRIAQKAIQDPADRRRRRSGEYIVDDFTIMKGGA